MTTKKSTQAVGAFGCSRRQLLKTVGPIVLAGGLSTGPSVASAAPGSTTAQQAVTQESQYQGVAQTTVQVGDGINTTDHSYTQEVVVVFGPPRGGADGLAETNPFNLFVSPADPNTTGQPGVWELHSAMVFDNVLFQFWELNRDEAWTITGQLTEPHNQEAIAVNLINLETPLIPGRPQLGVNTLSKAMGVGTELRGAVTQESTTIEIAGRTIDEFSQFQSQLEAARVA